MVVRLFLDYHSMFMPLELDIQTRLIQIVVYTLP